MRSNSTPLSDVSFFGIDRLHQTNHPDGFPLNNRSGPTDNARLPVPHLLPPGPLDAFLLHLHLNRSSRTEPPPWPIDHPPSRARPIAPVDPPSSGKRGQTISIGRDGGSGADDARERTADAHPALCKLILCERQQRERAVPGEKEEERRPASTDAEERDGYWDGLWDDTL